MEISWDQRKHHGVTDGTLIGFVDANCRGKKVRHETEILVTLTDQPVSNPQKSMAALKMEMDHNKTEDLGGGVLHATLENAEHLNLPHATSLSLAALTSALAEEVE